MLRFCLSHAFLLLLGANLISIIRAQDGFVPNYDEARIPAYKLPDPLVFENGQPVTNLDDWKKRHTEILALFETHIYGRTPTHIPEAITHQKRKSTDFLGGKAVLEEIRITISTKQGERQIDLLLIKPKAAENKKIRTFLTLNFRGNHTLHPSPEISLPESWQSDDPNGAVVKNRATEKGRGTRASRWPIETIIDSGIAFGSICYHDIEPDSPKQSNNNEASLPVDQHQLISLIAPRMVHIASARDDRWADPRGEFLSALHASPVWKLHGLLGIDASEMPPLHQPIGGSVRYHIRAGDHDVTEYDWQQYITSLLAVP